jgi:RNA polymerase sigma-70 factor (ECF subfamily)
VKFEGSDSESLSELKEEDLPGLVHRAAAGDRETCHRLYVHFQARIFNFVFGLVRLREEAEDITQDAFVQAFQNLAGLKKPDRFEQWLYRIARNEVYQRFRKRRKGEIPLDAEAPEGSFRTEVRSGTLNPEDEFLHDELNRVVERTLQGLPLKLREVFILAVIQEMSYKDIADIVGRSLLSVKTDIYRARVFAKEMIRRYLTQG